MQKTIIESNRLYLNKIELSDFKELCKMLQDKDVMYAWEKTFSDKEVIEWIKKRENGYSTYGYDYFLAINKETSKVIGQIGILNENIKGENYIGIGWILNKSEWGKGYATEGALACIDYVFNVLKVDKVIADIRPTNAKSINVAMKIGMKPVGRFIKAYDGKEVEHTIYQKNNTLILEKI
ncbi:MAG: GNAT family N-acetyltransferase [Clostridia bacterium]